MLLREPDSIIDGIQVFCHHVEADHGDYLASHLDDNSRYEEEHFWFIARREKILKVFDGLVSRDSHVLEVGAGTGSVTAYLREAGYEISAGEMHKGGLEYALKRGIKNCYQFDIFDSPFKDHFDVIGMFDVLEHLQDDTDALLKLKDMLHMNGMLLLTAPAHHALWCREDLIARHKRRYSIKDLAKKVSEAGFEIVFSQYFFSFITPLLIIRRLISPASNGATNKYNENPFKLNRMLNSILLKLSRIENCIPDCIPRPFGGSIIMVAMKK